MVSLVLVLSIFSSVLNFSWSAESTPEVIDSYLGQRIIMEDVPSSGSPGYPLMPKAPLMLVLPEGAVADSILITSTNSYLLSSNFVPMAAQVGVPFSRPTDFVVTQPDEIAFSKTTDISVRLENQGTLMGYPVVDFVLTPVSWDPLTKQLYCATEVQFQLYYHFEPSLTSIPQRGIAGTQVIQEILSASVLNPEHIGIVAAPSTDLPWGEYLIIADDSLAVSFEPLAEWKTQKGIESKIVLMSYISTQYSGVDEAQKLRFFLSDIYQDSPPTYILLAGDTPGVPHRNCYATAEGYVDYPSSDLYFQDMNDTAVGVDAWNLDGDDIWGELDGSDNMDYHPDYILGRASVETTTEADIFVNKVITWENSPDTDGWYNSMGFTTEILWSSPYCPGSVGKEKVADLYTPSTWDITKYYESDGSQSYTGTMAMLNTGMQFVNHAGHGGAGSVSFGVGSLSGSDFMGLTNISENGRPTIWNTIACLSGSFDTGTCLAEAWIRSPNGGGFCIMNTRYGWGEPAEPGDQWSELVDQEFFAKFFQEDMYNLGVAFMMAKDEFIALIPSDTHYDWIAKCNTLFGDPELPMYSTIPSEIEIGTVYVNEGDESLTVTVTSNSSALEGARVCLLQGEWETPVTYSVGITDASGNVTLTFPSMPGAPNQARVTVWARDHVLFTEMLVVGNMGVEDESTSLSANLSIDSPNPVYGNAAISWSLPEFTTATLSIIDLAGRTVTSQHLEETQGLFNWQTNQSPAGIYFVRMVTSTGQTEKMQIVVVH